MELVGTIETIDEPIAIGAKRHVRQSSTFDARSEVQRESLLIVNVNDIPTFQVGCSASNLAELVCGRLYTEGLVKSLDEVEALSVCEQSLKADVYLVDREADLTRRSALSIPTCCTNNKTLNSFFDEEAPLQPVAPIDWDDEWVYRIAEVFEQDKTLHRRTHGSHSAYLASDSGVLCLREDIGRHNAFDKAVGYALMSGIDLERCLLFTSGRIPTDMAAKAIRAGIPLLVSKAAATDRAVEMAREFGLALVCNATSSSFDVME